MKNDYPSSIRYHLDIWMEILIGGLWVWQEIKGFDKSEINDVLSIGHKRIAFMHTSQDLGICLDIKKISPIEGRNPLWRIKKSINVFLRISRHYQALHQ